MQTKVKHNQGKSLWHKKLDEGHTLLILMLWRPYFMVCTFYCLKHKYFQMFQEPFKMINTNDLTPGINDL